MKVGNWGGHNLNWRRGGGEMKGKRKRKRNTQHLNMVNIPLGRAHRDNHLNDVSNEWNRRAGDKEARGKRRGGEEKRRRGEKHQSDVTLKKEISEQPSPRTIWGVRSFLRLIGEAAEGHDVSDELTVNIYVSALYNMKQEWKGWAASHFCNASFNTWAQSGIS